MNVIEKIKEKINLICEKTRLDKKLLIVLALFAIGVIMLVISEIPKTEKGTVTPFTTGMEMLSADEYTAQLEERLSAIISAIDGVGAVRVMVTVESSGEDVYLHNYDFGSDEQADGANSFEQKDEYVIVDNEGSQGGIIVKERQPEIRGVAVVCQGASSEKVRQAVVQTVTALLDIGSSRVSVVEMG